MIVKFRKTLEIVGVIFISVVAIWLGVNAGRSNARASAEAVSIDRVLRYVRERFGMPETTKMTANPFRDSAFSGFYESLISIDDGKQKKTQPVFVTKDGHYLVVGQLYTLGSDPKTEIAQHVRELFKVPATTELTVGPPGKSSFPSFYQVTVIAQTGQQKQSGNFFVTKDNRSLILGSIFALTADPRREAVRSISTKNQPSEGPASAPVTIVEYADLQCPLCARLHEFFEKDLVPKYGGKVRLIFKEFPLATIHDWAQSAAIASQCAYQIDPEAFVAYRSLIFRNQPSINATNSRDMLLNLAAQAGIDSLKLAACLDSQASRPRVEEDAREGQQLGVASTPTTYVNGRIILGLPSPDAFYKAVEEALRDAK